ncbi:hypothetical protein [Azohydromonas lata]|uniref:hypothetical protein n=1 Tax=Azohydromonas lata TaxID=45677 RepID=UPI000A80AA56|nr:hypothetical protein [Azohydromonas lata]
MAYNKSTTIGEIYRLRDKVLAENDVFKIGKRDVAAIFLKKLLDFDEKTNIKYSELEAAYRASSAMKDIPEDSKDFWKYVEENYLELKEEPKDKFTELSFQATEDLSLIAKNLKYINRERDILDERKRQLGRLSAEDRYYRNQLDYFENKNIVARNEIVEFLTDGIKHHAIRKASSDFNASYPIWSFFRDTPYAFGRAYKSYDVRSLDEYSNKFTDLPASGYREMIKECRQSYDKFKEYAYYYISGDAEYLPSVREKLEDLVKTSHVLARRKQVIDALLKHFDEKDYLSFVNIAPLQIEGIFADICREIGVSESQLDISSLNDKLEHIDGKINNFHYFEYYAFKFPVLRNLVAHGGLVDGDMEKTALHLMLDLLPVCDLTISKELPVNYALKVLDEAKNKNYEKVIEWLDLRDKVKIPDFYQVNEKIKEVEAIYTSQEFWNYLDLGLKRLNDVSQVKDCMPVKAAGKIKRSNLASAQAEKFLKSSGHVAAEAIKKRNEISANVKRLLNLSNDPPMEEPSAP